MPASKREGSGSAIWGTGQSKMGGGYGVSRGGSSRPSPSSSPRKPASSGYQAGKSQTSKPKMTTTAKPKKSPKGETFYHGSSHKFKPGETVKSKDPGGAFASRSYKKAAQYVTRGMGLPGGSKTPGNVYKVKPLGKTQSHNGRLKETRSPAGYKALGIAKPPAKTAPKASPPKTRKKKR